MKNIRTAVSSLLIIFYVVELLAQSKAHPKLMLPIGHNAPVNSAVFSPDGRRVVTASEDNIALIWDAQSGELLNRLKGHTENVFSAEFSPDGRRLVTNSEDNTAIIWDAQNGALIHRLERHNTYVGWPKFSSDGNLVLTTSDEAALIWDANSGRLIQYLGGHNDNICSAEFSPDGLHVVTVSTDGTFIVWDTQTGGLLYRLEGHTDEIRYAIFSPDGLHVVTVSKDGTFIVWDTQTGGLLHRLKGHSRAEFSSNGKLLATVYRDKTACIWDVHSGELLHRLEGHKDDVCSAVFSPDGLRLTTASLDKTARIWDVRTGTLLHQLEGHDAHVFSAEFSPDGRRVVTVSDDQSALIWDAQSGELLHRLVGHTDDIWSAAFSPDGRLVVTDSRDKTPRIWDLQTGVLLYQLKGHNRGVISTVFSPEGSRLLTASWDSTAIIWDAQNGKLLHRLVGHTHEIWSATFSPDGRLVATTSRDETTRIWDVQSGALIHRLEGNDGWVSRAKFSPDGSCLLTVNESGTIHIWDTQTSELLYELESNNAVFSPDSRLVAATSDDYAWIFDLQNGTLVHRFDINHNWYHQVEFSPDGRRLLTEDQIWDLESESLLHRLKGSSNGTSSIGFSPDGLRVVTTYNDTTRLWNAVTGELLMNFEGHIRTSTSISFTSDRLITYDNSLLRMYNLESGKHLYSFVAVDSTDYLVLHPDGYFDGTQGARDLLYFVCNGEVVDLAQLKDPLYLPGLVEKIMTGKPINLKKLSELDICEALPLVDSIKGRPYHYRITPRKIDLERVEVYVNDKRVFNLPVTTLRRVDQAYEFELDEQALSLHLIPGAANKVIVQGIVRTDAGSELKSRGFILSTPGRKGEMTPPRFFGLMIGVNEYKDPQLRLQYPVKDAQDMGQALEAAAVKLLGRENVFMYMVHSHVKPGYGYNTPEKEGIRQALEEIGQKARPEDLLFIFFAGHGAMQGTDEKLFTFLTAEASQLNPNTGISTREMQEWLSFEGPHKMRANKTILIIDACNSGQARKEMIAMLARTDDDTRRIRQVEDLKDKSGMFILAASAPDQAAYEVPSLEQGLLTYCLLSILKNNPDVLDDGKYLNVQKWFLESEQMQKQLAESLGLQQNAQPLGSANIRIGIVDDEVKGSIVLAKEKPLVLCDNALNSETFSDNLQLKKWINMELSGMSERGEKSHISFANRDTPMTNKLNVSYHVKGDQVICEVRLVKAENVLHSSSISGSKTDISSLAKKIVDMVILDAR